MTSTIHLVGVDMTSTLHLVGVDMIQVVNSILILETQSTFFSLSSPHLFICKSWEGSGGIGSCGGTELLLHLILSSLFL